jgi:hypothetical protein
MPECVCPSVVTPGLRDESPDLPSAAYGAL